MKWSKNALAISLGLLIPVFCQSLNAQEARKVRWLFSNEMGIRGGLSDVPRTQLFFYDAAPGVRLKDAFQVEIPVGLAVRWEAGGDEDRVLSRNVTAGIALGYHWKNTFLGGPITLRTAASSSILKNAYSGVDVGIHSQLFMDESEQAFISLGGGRFIDYGGNHSTWFIQAGIGFRLKR